MPYDLAGFYLSENTISMFRRVRIVHDRSWCILLARFELYAVENGQETQKKICPVDLEYYYNARRRRYLAVSTSKHIG